MPSAVFLLTPPFTQLNTPYPATAYLKGFLNTKGIRAFQPDLGIEVIAALFSRQGLTNLFSAIKFSPDFPENFRRIISLKNDYIDTIDSVMSFLQGKNPVMASLICRRDFLPEAERFQQADDLKWAFGSMGSQDLAKYMATMYLEDLSDLIKECIDPHFGFSRYAERLGRSANSFDGLYEELQNDLTFVDRLLIDVLEKRMTLVQPSLVCLSVPFPGNLYSSLRCAQWLKKNYPLVKIAMGGGFANTELRSLSDKRVFEFYDFITLDDGEAPLENLIHFIMGSKKIDELKRTFTLIDGEVVYLNNITTIDYKQGQVGTPDYSDFLLDKYISAIEVINPMHSLWSNGRWNKLTMAHGCYWGKCTFCDISLDYIKLYEPLTAGLLCDRMETIIAQTGQNGFHFVDEAAPPALMRALSIEIIKRKLVVTWWANIRFEKSFSRDLCLLLKSAGCIAVSGGLEVASDRLLKLIDKGITVAQVARVNKNFSEAGIMVHAYLMYGFPTQTDQETIDSLEMVRQLFAAGVLQSAFWHQFTMTAHSPVGLDPAKYKVQKLTDTIGSFANNDIAHLDPTGADHELFAFGLKKSLLNFMHGTCFDFPLQKWFDFKVPKTTIAPDFILKALESVADIIARPTDKVKWLGNEPEAVYFTQSKKGNTREMLSLTFQSKKETLTLQIEKEKGCWLMGLLKKLSFKNEKIFSRKEIQDDFENAGFQDFELFWDNKPLTGLYKMGLLQP